MLGTMSVSKATYGPRLGTVSFALAVFQFDVRRPETQTERARAVLRQVLPTRR